MADPDDEALRWGDEDPSHVAGPPASARPAAAASDDGPRPTGSAVLVAYGIVSGIALLYSIGWFIAVQRDSFVQASVFAEVMYQLGEFLAVASPLLWVAAVLLLVRADRTAVRLAWLGVGVVLLAPWPFILGG